MRIILLFFIVMLCGCTSTFDITKKDIMDKGSYAETGYYRIDFKGHEIIKMPPDAHIVIGTKDQAVGTVGEENKIGQFVVSGLISKEKINLFSQVNGYDYIEKFIIDDKDGHAQPLVRYMIENSCNGQTYEGVSDKHGQTVVMSTEKPCEISISFPDAID
ncbi:hypothetical protein FJU30_05760 [Affinibrenneria salicis]|uniref:Lipoprotein n=1 Tax=Affinibrenneria salicis TaxID=2590031 RepID=A0A5J5G4K6_9GAMM|nr:hypothetical protein [Affinibrenneria salicis]KAA9001795.1 hypothetical protein FJU30_05760 [Affinibrenneria salicis]